MPTAWWQDNKELSGLKPSVARRLIAAEYLTAEQIRAAGPKQLLQIDRLGRKGLHEIEVWLRKLDGNA